jgi:ABC-type branched-subunit amino acid transport system permease subunit
MSRAAKTVAWVAFAALAAVLGVVTDDQKILTTAIQVMMLGALAASWNILGGFAGEI